MRAATRRTVPVVAVALAAASALAGCTRAPGPIGPAPAPGPVEPRPELPPPPPATGPLELRVTYPADSAYVATRDRNFIFGSAGNGQARVWINGEEVEVAANGGFLAYLPVPTDGVYRLRATLAGDTAALVRPVRLPPAPPTGADGPRILPGSVSPSGAWVAGPAERIRVSFRGISGGDAWLAFADGVRVPLVPQDAGGVGATDFEVTPGGREDATDSPLTTYAGFFSARPVRSADTATAWPDLADPPSIAGTADSAGAHVVLVVRGDTAVRPLDLNLVVADPDRPRVGTGYDPDPPERNGDEHIIARPGPGGGPYHYVWRNGVELELTGERNGAYRVRLTDELSAWTPAGDIRLRAAGTPPPTSRVATVRLDPRAAWVDVHLALDRRLPYAVEQAEGVVTLLVYGATSRASFLQHGRVDPFVRRAEWSQPSDRLFRLDLHLAGLPWGYETFWSGDDLVLRLNRPPRVDPDAPLRGLTIGVDPGHGGAADGAVGATGLREADANLGIALALRDLLAAEGATVVMTRTDDATVSLVERTALARQRDVDLLISVHNNAFPDGVDPWANNGTSVYYNHAPAAGLAWSVLRALVEELGLRDLGVGRADLHLPRFTWAPSILTETAFMMVPIQEAFLRSDEGARRIAEAHLAGIRQWLRTLATDDDG